MRRHKRLCRPMGGWDSVFGTTVALALVASAMIVGAVQAACTGSCWGSCGTPSAQCDYPSCDQISMHTTSIGCCSYQGMQIELKRWFDCDDDFYADCETRACFGGYHEDCGAYWGSPQCPDGL